MLAAILSTIYIMRVAQVVLIISASLLNGCMNAKLLSKGRTEYGKMNFYIERANESTSHVTKVYAKADSSGIKTYFSFYPDRILKVTEKENLVFTGVSQKKPNLEPYQEVSKFDAAVFAKAVHILDSLQLHWSNPDSTIAFIPEVLYYHGRPKNFKLKPL